MTAIRVGTKVKHNNLYCTVVGLDGNALVLQPNGSSQKYSAPHSEVVVVLNESTDLHSFKPMNS